MPLVSVIVPNYNHAPYLRKRIDSILEQSFQDFELILLDDCSTDSSLEILAQYKNHPKVSVVVSNQINSGSPFKQWKKGIELAKGEYIWIAESDDWAGPDFLERMLKILENNKEVGISYAQSQKVDKNDHLLGIWDQWNEVFDQDRWSTDFVNEGKAELNQYFAIRNTIPNASAVVFRKILYRPLKGPILRMRLCGDKLFWADLLVQTHVAFTAEPLNYFRFSDQSARSSISSKLNFQENLIWFKHVKGLIDLDNTAHNAIHSWLLTWWNRLLSGTHFRNWHSLAFLLFEGARVDLRLARQMSILLYQKFYTKCRVSLQQFMSSL